MSILGINSIVILLQFHKRSQTVLLDHFCLVLVCDFEVGEPRCYIHSRQWWIKWFLCPIVTKKVCVVILFLFLLIKRYEAPTRSINTHVPFCFRCEYAVRLDRLCFQRHWRLYSPNHGLILNINQPIWGWRQWLIVPCIILLMLFAVYPWTFISHKVHEITLCSSNIKLTFGKYLGGVFWLPQLLLRSIAKILNGI